MATFIAIVTALGGIAGVVGWVVKGYLAHQAAVAAELERQSGADASQLDAQNAENARIVRAADAANSVRPGQADPYDLDK